jgi:predicted SAM-dependent methyltransferase
MAVPAGPMINAGSGPADPRPWINIDGSWQARLAGHKWLARAGSRFLGIEIGHWPRGVKYCDVRRGLGYPDGSLAVVYASHMLEHLYRDEALRFLEDAHRALMPEGVCRIVVPDVEQIVHWYLAHQRESVETRREPSSDMLMGLLLLRSKSVGRGSTTLRLARRLSDLHEHKWMYDREGLIALFREAGFRCPASCAFLDSAIPRAALEQVEQRDRVENGAGVCVESRK